MKDPRVGPAPRSVAWWTCRCRGQLACGAGQRSCCLVRGVLVRRIMAVRAWLSISIGGARCSVHDVTIIRVTIIRQTGVRLCKYHLVTRLFYHWSGIIRGGVIRDGIIRGAIAGGGT